MKTKSIIATGSVGLLIALVSGYAFQLIVSIAGAIPGSSGHAYNAQAWGWFIACCFGLALAAGSALALLFRRVGKSA